MPLDPALRGPPALDHDEATRSLIDWALFLATLDDETSRALHQQALKVGHDLAVACHAARAVDRTAVDLFGSPPPAAMRRSAIHAVATQLEHLWREACQPEPAGVDNSKESRE